MAGEDPGGGSSALGQLIADGHGGALRADLQRFYGLDLADVWRGTLTPRRAWQLTEHLPPDSALAALLAGGPEHRGWTVQAHLLAQLLNAVRYADANNVRVSGGRLKREPVPVNVPQVKADKHERPRLDLSNHPLAKPIAPRG
ncbi:hypothetical protein ACIGW8_06105 [Streptomyces sioyaensis]|uniref:hypothetical protein n=1 Tax=Streptomyces sioyaensis TaxID=67364 RepID=UPI0037D43003